MSRIESSKASCIKKASSITSGPRTSNLVTNTNPKRATSQPYSSSKDRAENPAAA